MQDAVLKMANDGGGLGRSPVISATWLVERLADGRGQGVLVDARSGPHAGQHYLDSHLSGSVWADLETDLSTPADPADGGRHPLPTAAVFSSTLARWGVTPATPVFIYDDAHGANAASRLWWMLRHAGHEAAFVVDGGYQALLAAGAKMAAGPSEARPVSPPYPVSESFGRAGVVRLDDVNAAARDGLLIDVRAAERFAGVHEPIDPVAGHIPGAVNVPLTENLLPATPDGVRLFRPVDVLRSQYEALFTSRGIQDVTAVTVSCGSGVTACHTLLALELAGLTGAKLFVGSFSEWCRRGLPIMIEASEANDDD